MSGSIEALCRTAFSGRKRVRSGESSSSTANAVGGTRRRAGRGARNDEALGDGEDDEEDEGEGVEEANISRSSNHGGTTATSKAPPPPPRLPSSSRGPVVTAPQLEFVDGKFVVRESSLVLGHDSLPSHLTLEEGVVDHPATYTSYRMKTFNSKAPWGVEETRTFYRAIQQVGLDYSLLQCTLIQSTTSYLFSLIYMFVAYMPGRTRKQIKHKFFRYRSP